MSSNYIFLDNNGVIVTDTANVKETVQQEFQEALGETLVLDDSTPQGRLIDMETNARVAVIENNAMIANLFNIRMAFGVALDALGANFGVERIAASSSSVIATVTGIGGTVIPAGSQASTQSGYIFYAENDITIPEGGTTTATFLSLEKGEIPCPVGSLSKIIDGTFGWETITNTAAAILGVNKESDESFKARIIAGLFSGTSLLGDYESALSKIENVNSSFVYDNPTGETITYDTVSIKPHSVYVCVDGGNNNDVAKAIFNVKSGGSDWNGNTTVSVTDETYGGVYSVSFQRATQIQIYVQVNIDIGTASTSNPIDAVTDAVNTYINKLKVGADVLPFQIAAYIDDSVSGIKITNLQIGTSAGSLSTSDIVIRINEVAKVQTTNITVVINE